MYTISRDYRKEIVIEKSRFICSLKKVHSEAEAQEFIKAVKKEFWDATHNCSAYIVDDLAQRSSDDGEPSGTAGIPMLEVLRKNGLTETAAVVTRYFGGIKLGAGGLDAKGKPKDTRTIAQRGSLVKLLIELKQKFPKAAIRGHNEMPGATNKECPCFLPATEFAYMNTQLSQVGK